MSEVDDILSGTHETHNLEDVPKIADIVNESVVVEDKILVNEDGVEVDAAGEPVPMVIQPEEETSAFADPDKVPNVMLSAQGNALPKGPVIVGRTKIELPDEQGQRAGFYTEYAGILVGQYPQFKFKREKDGSVPSVTL